MTDLHIIALHSYLVLGVCLRERVLGMCQRELFRANDGTRAFTTAAFRHADKHAFIAARAVSYLRARCL